MKLHLTTLDIMENNKELKNIPWGYELCFNENCELREKCMHYQAYLRAEARRRVRRYFSGGCGPYYRYHHGENLLSPRQQEDIMQILAAFGSTEGIRFDHYEADWDFK